MLNTSLVFNIHNKELPYFSPGSIPQVDKFDHGGRKKLLWLECCHFRKTPLKKCFPFFLRIFAGTHRKLSKKNSDFKKKWVLGFSSKVATGDGRVTSQFFVVSESRAHKTNLENEGSLVHDNSATENRCVTMKKKLE